MLELNSETDFVSRNDEFGAVADALGKAPDLRADFHLRQRLCNGGALAVADERDRRILQVLERGRRAVLHRRERAGQPHAFDHFGGRAVRAAIAHVAGHERQIPRGQLPQIVPFQRFPQQLKVGRGVVASAVTRLR